VLVVVAKVPIPTTSVAATRMAATIRYREVVLFFIYVLNSKSLIYLT
jgi:hypothetical protein